VPRWPRSIVRLISAARGTPLTEPAVPTVTEVTDGSTAQPEDDAADSLLSFLTRETGAGAGWRALLRRLPDTVQQLADGIARDLNPDEQYYLLMYLLRIVGDNALRDHELGGRLFKGGETMGVHLMAAHYYSPVPVVTTLTDDIWKPYTLLGLDWRIEEQRALLARLSRWSAELDQFPDSPSDEPTVFHFDNSALGRTDAAVYYAILREFRPSRVLEVGGGFSTLLSARAAMLNGSTSVDCIEPYPMAALLHPIPGLRRLIEQPVQTVPIEEFSRLGRGDVLFIDCSHVSKIGSDANHLILRVLPNLQDGVLVHIHDIFLPDEYPQEWVMQRRIFWTEQYLLHAFLLFNSSFRILCSSHFLGKHFPDDVRAAFPACRKPGGGSLWFERYGGAHV